MHNRLLSITRRMIPYIPELNAITGGIVASVLMQQLDYWFERYPDGFYKFMEPCQHDRYKPGESWTEDLSITRSEFRSAFDCIGYRFSSKSDYINAPDKFLGRMYASYVDRKSNLTYYFRNHEMVDRRLNEMILARQQVQAVDFTADPNQPVPPPVLSVAHPNQPVPHPNPPVTPPILSVPHPNLSVTHSNQPVTAATSSGQGMQIPDVTRELSSPLGSDIPAVPTTDTTTDTTSVNQLLLQQTPPETRTSQGSSSNLNQSKKLHYPNILGGELKAIEKALEFCPDALHQDVLDEIEGIRACGKITRGAIPLAKALVKKIAEGQFVLSAGVGVRAQREQRQANEAAVKVATSPLSLVGQTSAEMLAQMPANVARKIREAEAKAKEAAS